jgi:2-methylaconitate isomerase
MKSTYRSVPAVWMRGGTSKGLFFADADLPADSGARDSVILNALGSPDSYGRQLDGVGGATSSTSKAVIITPSSRTDCDVEYLFAHVAIEHAVIDYSGNCGNLSAAVGVYAIEQGLVEKAAPPVCTVRVWQANLGQRLLVRVPVDDEGRVLSCGDYTIAGVSGRGARIAVDFLLSEDAQNGVLPTGRPRELLDVEGFGACEVSLIAAGNPTVFIRPETLGLTGTELPGVINARSEVLLKAEAIRAHAAWRMGLVASPAEASDRPATPKLAFVCAPRDYVTTDGSILAASDMDVCVRIFSMGQLHQAITATGAIAVAVAARIPGSLVADCSRASDGHGIRIGHSAGTMEVDAVVTVSSGRVQVECATIYRTARSLMRGQVYVREER